MEKMNEAFTTAVWNVKPGKVEEFIKEWTEFARWSLKDDGTAQLFQDAGDPSRFISVGRWNHAETLESWRGSAEVKERLAKMGELLTEPSKPHVMKEVSKVGDHVVV